MLELFKGAELKAIGNDELVAEGKSIVGEKHNTMAAILFSIFASDAFDGTVSVRN